MNVPNWWLKDPPVLHVFFGGLQLVTAGYSFPRWVVSPHFLGSSNIFWDYQAQIIQWEFQDPKMEVPTIYKAYFSGLCKGIYPQNMARNMVQYLHFRILEFPLNHCQNTAIFGIQLARLDHPHPCPKGPHGPHACERCLCGISIDQIDKEKLICFVKRKHCRYWVPHGYTYICVCVNVYIYIWVCVYIYNHIYI